MRFQMLTVPAPTTFRRFTPKPTVAAACCMLAMVTLPSIAWADRCKPNASGQYICTYQERNHSFATASTVGRCNGKADTRVVRWQVPEGTPPEGGWPVVFFYQGTVPAFLAGSRAFDITSNAFGAKYFQASLHELLDDPQHTGKKYAVVSPDASAKLGMRFWDTNQPGNYAGKDDFCFLPDLFQKMTSGAYGTASQFNMGKRFAYGISSGGYNTSRMAVSFNDGSQWSALAVVSASYATCAGPLCTVPATLPANHPPTKFYHGTSDPIVPIGTMRPYFQKLTSQGIATEKVEHSGGHEFTADVLGSNGVKAWFDRF